MTNQKKKIRILAMDLLYDVIGSIFYAIGLYTFARMAEFAPGGLSGLALIMNHLWGLPIGITTLVLNIPIILVSCRILGRMFFLKSLKTIIISSVFMDYIAPMLPVYEGSRFLAALCMGVLCGFGYAVIFMRGSSTGGQDFISMAVGPDQPPALSAARDGRAG